MAETTSAPSPAELVEALLGPSPSYKGEELEAVDARLAECVPSLAALVAAVAEDPDGAGDWEDGAGFGLIYALFLLARSRSTEGHEALMALLRHPQHVVDELLGDTVTENLATWLFATAPDGGEGIRRLAVDDEVGGWVRAAAIDALGMLVLDGAADRDEVLALARGLLASADVPDQAPFLATTVAVLCWMADRDSESAMLRALEEGRIEAWSYAPQDLLEMLTRAEADPRGYLERSLANYLPDDLHACFAGWACFGATAPRVDVSLRQGPAAREAARKRRNKRKAQKKARRRQRRKR